MPAEVMNKGKARQRNVGRERDGTEMLQRLTRDGAAVSADWLVACALEGRVFQANYGQGTTVVACKTGLTAAQPDTNLDIPFGTTVIPLAIHVAMAVMAGTANHIFFQAGTGNVVGNGTSTAADSLVNVFQGQGFQSGCTARKAYSGSGTAPGTGSSANPGTLSEIASYEAVVAAAAGVQQFYDWNCNFALPTILIGPASISGYGVSTGSAASVKVILTFLEFPSDWVSA